MWPCQQGEAACMLPAVELLLTNQLRGTLIRLHSFNPACQQRHSGCPSAHLCHASCPCATARCSCSPPLCTHLQRGGRARGRFKVRYIWCVAPLPLSGCCQRCSRPCTREPGHAQVDGFIPPGMCAGSMHVCSQMSAHAHQLSQPARRRQGPGHTWQ
jgi:hypothetical protein